MNEINLRTEAIGKTQKPNNVHDHRDSGDRFDNVLSDVDKNHSDSRADSKDDARQNEHAPADRNANADHGNQSPRLDASLKGSPEITSDTQSASRQIETDTPVVGGNPQAGNVGETGQPQMPNAEDARNILIARLADMRTETGEPVFSNAEEIEALADLLLAAQNIEELPGAAPEFARLLAVLRELADTLLSGQPATIQLPSDQPAAIQSASDQPKSSQPETNQPETNQPASAQSASRQQATNPPAFNQQVAATLIADIMSESKGSGRKNIDLLAGLTTKGDTGATKPLTADQAAALKDIAATVQRLSAGTGGTKTVTPAAPADLAENPAMSTDDPIIVNSASAKAPRDGKPVEKAFVNGGPASTLQPSSQLRKNGPDQGVPNTQTAPASDDGDDLLARMLAPAKGTNSTTGSLQSSTTTSAAANTPHTAMTATVIATGMQDISAPLTPQIDGANVVPVGQTGLDGSLQQSAHATMRAVPAGLLTPTVAADIARFVQRNETRFEIRLDPPELGRVSVRLRIAEDGMVRAHLFVEQPETLDLFQRDARALERALEQNGLKTAQGGLQFSLGSGGAGNPFADDAALAGEQTDDNGDDNETTDHVAANYHLTLARDGRVDFRV